MSLIKWSKRSPGLWVYLIILICISNVLQGESLPMDSVDEYKANEVAIETALKIAKDQNKKVMIIFTAEWCGDCTLLDKKMKESTINDLVVQNFIVVKVDVGKTFKKNPFAKDHYGKILRKGIPSMVITDKNHRVLYETLNGEIEPVRTFSTKQLYDWFVKINEMTDQKNANPSDQ